MVRSGEEKLGEHREKAQGGPAPAYAESDLRPFSLWRHLTSGSHYLVLGVGLCGTNGPREHQERSVHYVSLTHQRLCYREVGEFLDGRFAPVPVGTVF